MSFKERPLENRRVAAHIKIRPDPGKERAKERRQEQQEQDTQWPDAGLEWFDTESFAADPTLSP
jgi:hypothetical protein